jgi:hypothetical protein
MIRCNRGLSVIYTGCRATFCPIANGRKGHTEVDTGFSAITSQLHFQSLLTTRDLSTRLLLSGLLYQR